MMGALPVRREPVALTDIAEAVRTEHAAAAADFQSAVGHAIRCGEHLTEAKAQVPHGGWGEWLAEHCPFSQRTAQGYMRLAAAEDAQALAHLGIEGALKQLAAPGPAEGEARNGPPPPFADFDEEGWYSLAEHQRLHLHHLAQSIAARTEELEDRARAEPDIGPGLEIEARVVQADGKCEVFAHAGLYHLEHAPEGEETSRLRARAHGVLADLRWGRA
jgi:hypothetical protein